MPTSKKGKKYYTKEQLERAKAQSALDYAQEHHYDLIQQGSRFILRDHDSMIFLQDGRWFWNSRCVSGRALDLLIYYEDWPIVDAVLHLAGEVGNTPDSSIQCRHTETIPPQRPPFILPPRSATQKHLFAYLCGYRKLDIDIIRELLQQKRLYESVYRYKPTGSEVWRECYNAVFLGLDVTGKPQSAYQRGASSKSSFKCEVPSSNKLEHPFILPGQPWTNDVCFFEASIDAISHATWYKLRGLNYKIMERVAMGGVVADVAASYLAQHPEKKYIHLCLDGDIAGTKGTARVETALRKKGYDESEGYTYTIEKVPEGKKDWNEYLMAFASSRPLCGVPTVENPSVRRVYHGPSPRSWGLCLSSACAGGVLPFLRLFL